MIDQLFPVVVVHGVGIGENRDRAGFSRNLSDSVTETQRPVIRVGPNETPFPEPVPENSVMWEEALWEGENTAVDNQIAFSLELAMQNHLAREIVKKTLDLLGDVPLYLGPQGFRIRNVVKTVVAKHPNCVLVGHSLGSVILYDILRQAQDQDDFMSLPVSSFITLGSPLSLLFDCLPPPSRMKKEFPFKWHNFYFPNDLICAKKQLDPEDYLNVCNHQLNPDKSLGESHTAYWSMSAVSNTVYRLTRG